MARGYIEQAEATLAPLDGTPSALALAATSRALLTELEALVAAAT